MTYRFIDIHSHVHGVEYDTDREALMIELADFGGATITIGTDYEESERAREVAEKYSNVFFCAGIHPVDKRDEVYDSAKLRELATHPKCVGIGECGLDYYWPSEYKWSDGEAEEKERQATLFRGQIGLAIEMDLPLMIHGRPSKNTMDAYEDIIKILQEYKAVHGHILRGNIHFFVGSREIAEQFIVLGFTMSFTGVITFTHDYDEVIRCLPVEYIQAETDSPYVSPKPYRGKRNEAKHVTKVIERMAEIRNITKEELEKELLANAKRVWGIE
jgi:TatD DNase family protein